MKPFLFLTGFFFGIFLDKAYEDLRYGDLAGLHRHEVVIALLGILLAYVIETRYVQGFNRLKMTRDAVKASQLKLHTRRGSKP